MIDYQFLIELGAICGSACFVLSRVLDYAKERVKSAGRVQQKQISGQGVSPRISSLIENIDVIIDDAHKQRAAIIKQMEATGATQEQQTAALQPVDARLRQFEFIQKNKTWLQFVAPYADELASAGLKLLARVRF